MQGVVNTWVGYTGGAAPDPTYKSVCSGDGHTEALRIEFDPETLSFERLITRYFADPHVRSTYGREKPQYRTAIWAQTREQEEIARRVGGESGKLVPILPASPWYDAEDYHQHFLGDFKDLPEERWDEE
mmetsp:Transcript_52246/g.117364  ORF Transcript_52246/g.117364 Transcript_52246/m.117364 type:complete len:129 (-) Transcript_52246:405-791(-)